MEDINLYHMLPSSWWAVRRVDKSEESQEGTS